MIRVRPAISSDIDWIVQELRSFSDFYRTKKPLFQDEKYAKEFITNAIHEHVVFVAEKDFVGPIGFIAGLLIPHIFNPTIRVLNEAFWWVPEAYRHSKAGYLLLKEFIEFGKKNVDWILFTLEEGSPVNEFALIDRGFTPKERNYLMEVS